MLFSDVEGSTALLVRLGDRYGEALSAQRALLRAEFANCHGQELGTEGDSFFVVFSSAADAVRCSVAAQRALASHDWPDGAAVRVRMGLHSGEPVRHEGGYVGLDVHRAARIAAVAHGGQVLLSEATRLLVSSRLPPGVSIRDLGFYRLKDIAAPERIYQLVAPGLPEHFAPLASPLAETQGSPEAAVSAPIVGRNAERTSLLATYARVVAGQTKVLLLTGAAGIGKTRLVEELCAQAASAAGSAQVLIGESAPLAGAALAYGPFVAALRDHAGWLLADDGSGDMLVARHRLFVRVLELLAGLAEASPVVLVLEDLHWADESSRELLAFLAVRLHDKPVMVIGTLREEELAGRVGHWLAEMERRPGVTRMRLKRLADGEIEELVTALLPSVASAERVAALVAAADGNPLYATELAYAYPDALPASITDAVLAQAAVLTAQAKAVVDQACVMDGGIPHDLLAATVQLSEKRLLAATRRAVDCGLLVTVGDGYAFGHSLIRQVLYDRLLPGERLHLHRQLAEALAARADSDPGLLAHHWHLAGSPEHAARASVLAARHAVSARAYPEAVRHYALAIELASWLPEFGPALIEQAAQAASWSGDPDRAVAWAVEALEKSASLDPVRQARLLERVGRYRFEAGDLHAAIEATQRALVLLSDGAASALRARLLASLANWRMLLGEFSGAQPIAVQAIEEAQRAGAVAEHAHGLATLGVVQAHNGELDAGLGALRRSLAFARRTGNVEDVVRAATNLTYLLHTAGHFAEALQVAQDGRQAAKSLDAPPAQTAALDNNAAAVLVATGQWQEADQLLAEVIAESSAKAARYIELLQLELAVGRGDRQQAASLAANLLKVAPEDPGLVGPLRACLAEQALYAGDPAAAATEVLDGLAALAGTEWSEDEIRLLADGAWAAADLAARPTEGRPGKLPDGWEFAAATFDDRAGTISARDSAGRPGIAAFGEQAAAEHRRERGADDAATWSAVADAWRKAGQPYREAYARIREAEAATRAGQREQSTSALTAGRAIARQLRSEPLLSLAAEIERSADWTLSDQADLSTTRPLQHQSEQPR